MKQKNILQVEVTTSEALISELIKEVGKILDAKISKLDPPKEKDLFLTRQDVADMFKITLPTVHAWVNAQILKPYKIGNKTRFLLTEVKAAAINKGSN